MGISISWYTNSDFELHCPGCLSTSFLIELKNGCFKASIDLILFVWSSSSILSSKSNACGSCILQSWLQLILSFYISSGIRQPYPYLKAISFIALLPKRQVRGIKFEMVKFLILLELFRLNTGWRPAQKERKITPIAQMSTAEVCVW